MRQLYDNWRKEAFGTRFSLLLQEKLKSFGDGARQFGIGLFVVEGLQDFAALWRVSRWVFLL